MVNRNYEKYVNEKEFDNIYFIVVEMRHRDKVKYIVVPVYQFQQLDFVNPRLIAALCPWDIEETEVNFTYNRGAAIEGKLMQLIDGSEEVTKAFDKFKIDSEINLYYNDLLQSYHKIV